MLERPALRLLPWTSPAPEDRTAFSRVRGVQALDNNLILGSVREKRRPAWLGCGPRRLEVCETEDAALLMSIECGWFGLGRWHVLDAERCRVGSVLGRQLLAEPRGRFATLWHEGARASAIRDRQGRVVARLEEMADGAETLHFADDLEANPFLRMVLLAACLVQPK